MCSAQTPVVVIHRTTSVPTAISTSLSKTTLDICLEQLHNAHNEIILAGTNESLSLGIPLTHLHIDTLIKNELSQNFEQSYVHISNISSYEFEYFCIQRWFLLLEIMRKTEKNRICYIDTDVLMYDTADEIMRRYGGDVGFCAPKGNVAAGHISYWTEYTLERFCLFILYYYTNKLDVLQNIPHISDMFFFSAWETILKEKKSTINIVNLLERKDGYVLDGNFNISHNLSENEFMLSYNRKKKIRFYKKKPHGFIQQNGEKCRFGALHFQGIGKVYMKCFLSHPRHHKRLYYPLTREIIKNFLWFNPITQLYMKYKRH